MHIHVRGPPDYPQFDDSLAGLTGLSKAVILMDMISYSERIQIKISKWNRYIGRGSGETSFQLPGILNQRSPVDSLHSHSKDKTASAKWCQPEKLTEPWSLGFFWWLVTQVCSTSVNALSYSVSSPLKVKPFILCGPGPLAYKKKGI